MSNTSYILLYIRADDMHNNPTTKFNPIFLNRVQNKMLLINKHEL